MKKMLTEDQFQAAVRDLKVGPQTLEIAHGVLVLGLQQSTFVKSLGISRGAVSQAVNRVWEAQSASEAVPNGYERITVVLPERQAFIAKKWARENKPLDSK